MDFLEGLGCVGLIVVAAFVGLVIWIDIDIQLDASHRICQANECQYVNHPEERDGCVYFIDTRYDEKGKVCGEYSLQKR